MGLAGRSTGCSR
jgi:hypothetical protein